MLNVVYRQRSFGLRQDIEVKLVGVIVIWISGRRWDGEHARRAKDPDRRDRREQTKPSLPFQHHGEPSS
jgi:hypothetical protein